MTRRRGSLLIDVLAALTLLGTTAVALILAHARAVEQFAATQKQTRAAGIADELLAEWRLARVHTGHDASGVVEGEPGWSWRRATESFSVADAVEMTQVQLDIAIETSNGRTVVATLHWLESPEAEHPPERRP